MNKTIIKTMRLDSQELECILTEAKRRNMTFSDFMREAARSFFAYHTHDGKHDTHIPAPALLVDPRAEYQAASQKEAL